MGYAHRPLARRRASCFPLPSPSPAEILRGRDEVSKLLERIQRQSELVVLEISVVLSQESYVLLLQLLDVDRGPAVDFGQVLLFWPSAPPVGTRHDSTHELIEKRHGKCGIPVIRAPTHSLGNELITCRTQGSHATLQARRNITRAMRPRSQLGHRAHVGKPDG